MVGETIGFEMIVPSLLEEINELCILRRATDTRLIDLIYSRRNNKDISINESASVKRPNRVLGRLVHGRAAKLKALPKWLINRHFAHAFSAEMAGTDGIYILDLEHMQEVNGSVGHSPAATAHYAVYGRRGSSAAIKYLCQVVQDYGSDGEILDVAPFDFLNAVGHS